MTNILRIDASVRTGISGTNPHGSLSRRLTELFINTWAENDSSIQVKHRDVGKNPPPLIDEEWIVSEFGYAESEEKAQQRLKLSDELIAELKWADLIVIGVPMYNFGPPAHLKAYIDNIVRKDKTYAFDADQQQPYTGLLDAQKPLVILSARGGHDFDAPDAPFQNHVEPSIKTAFNFIGIQQFHEIAIEYQEYGGELLEKSIQQAEQKTTALIHDLQQKLIP
ncbi:flavin reductase [Acinetobacter chinensis]|uniref:FMN dependent NADH:quinone oxidoreductase n=1 Tax=Acinetobacter chinensis TaxID=2004650 RepID=A0A3B7LZ65_9GAMM|nr:NAD(P)H-dependent oxidoreductase [Acinetobacter chinensis]AXY57234.1 flavin reductase [Acinetobacter chinensis]